MTNFFNELQKSTQEARAEFLRIPQIQDGAKGLISLETYIAYLTEAYHHVKHTVPLLMLTGSRLNMEQEWLRVAIAEYIEEELGHQEWILNDIKHAGGNSETVRSGKPNTATELMISYIYDRINRKNPISFFGMVFVLEGTSQALATTAGKTLMQNLNLKPNCFSYLLSHGSLDQGHLKFFEDLMNKLSKTEDKEAVIHTANMIYKLYGDIFRSIPHPLVNFLSEI